MTAALIDRWIVCVNKYKWDVKGKRELSWSIWFGRVQRVWIKCIGVARGGLGTMHPIFGTYSHFVLWEAVSQTKYCYLPKIKHFGPSQILVWPRHWLRAVVGPWKGPFTQFYMKLGGQCERGEMCIAVTSRTALKVDEVSRLCYSAGGVGRGFFLAHRGTISCRFLFAVVAEMQWGYESFPGMELQCEI